MPPCRRSAVGHVPARTETGSPVSEDDPDSYPDRDFLISYVAADRPWAEWIAWTLEKAGYQVHIRGWDAVPGAHVHALDDRGMRARQTLAVVTARYLAAVGPEANHQLVARAEDPDGAGRKLIPICVADDQLFGPLAHRVPINLFGLPEADARHRLLSEIEASRNGRGKPTQRPDFPVAVATVTGPTRVAGPNRSGPRFPALDERARAAAELSPRRLSVTPSVLPASLAGVREVRHADDESVTVLFVDIRPDTGVMVSCGDDGMVVLWDLPAGGPPRRRGAAFAHPEPVRAAVFSPTGDLLATCCDDGNVRLWEMSSGQPARILGHPDPPTGCAFSPDGSIVVTVCETSGAYRWTVATGVSERGPGGDAVYTALAVSPDARAVAVAWPDRPGTDIATFSGSTGAVASCTLPIRGEVRALSFSRDGRWLATRGANDESCVWDVATGRPAPPPRALGGGLPRTVALADDGETLAVARMTATGYILQIITVATGATSEIFDYRWLPFFLTFAPDGTLLAARSPVTRFVRLHWLTTPGGAPPRAATVDLAHPTNVTSVAFSPDGAQLATAAGASIAVWDVSDLCPGPDTDDLSETVE